MKKSLHCECVNLMENDFHHQSNIEENHLQLSISRLSLCPCAPKSWIWKTRIGCWYTKIILQPAVKMLTFVFPFEEIYHHKKLTKQLLQGYPRLPRLPVGTAQHRWNDSLNAPRILALTPQNLPFSNPCGVTCRGWLFDVLNWCIYMQIYEIWRIYKIHEYTMYVLYMLQCIDIHSCRFLCTIYGFIRYK